MDRRTGEDNVEVVWEELKEGILWKYVECQGQVGGMQNGLVE